MYISDTEHQFILELIDSLWRRVGTISNEANSPSADKAEDQDYKDYAWELDTKGITEDTRAAYKAATGDPENWTRYLYDRLIWTNVKLGATQERLKKLEEEIEDLRWNNRIIHTNQPYLVNVFTRPTGYSHSCGT